RRASWYLYLLLKNRWFLIKALLVIMIPTIIVTFLLEKKYTVTTVIMPPETQSNPGITIAGMGISDFTGYFSGGMGFSLPLMTTMSDVYDEILNSRTLIENVILSTGYINYTNERERFEQDEQLGLYWARRAFRKNYSAGVTPSGFLQVEVTTNDPWYSVEVSEAVIVALDSINSDICRSRAEQTRMFLEIRSSMADSILESTGEMLREFEEEYGIISLDQEMEAYIQSLAELKQHYILLRTTAAAIRRGISGGSSASALLKEREADELLGIIEMLETGIAPPGYESVMPSVSIEDLPDIQFRYVSIRAEYEMALELTSAIRISLQQAIVEENRENPPVRVLDPPRHPGWKSRPKKLYIWIEVFAVAFIFLFGYLIVRENINALKMEKPEEWRTWQNLFSEIRRDLRFRKRKRP
ncbi:MAG: hypothetical protein KAQ97_08395, partial [Candidatus Fermentibacteraceae bacterium]|nr:hypothetical protein [Candidatus Fermentibacteraceae bacterium]